MLINNKSVLVAKGGVGEMLETPTYEHNQETTRLAVASDSELTAVVERARQRDRQAYATLYEYYCVPIYDYVLFKVGQVEVAEDISGQVFLKMIENIARFSWRDSQEQGTRGAAFAGWLYRIAHNLIADHLRRNARRPTVPLDAVAINVSDLHDPVTAAEFSIYRTELAAALTHLTDLQSQVIALKYGAGLSNAEVGHLLARTEGAIKNVQYTALQKLQKLLRAEGQH